MTRGDVVLVRFPHPSGVRGKKRPAVVVQADRDAPPRTVMVAEVTTNLAYANDPACLLIEADTEIGRATGLLQDSVISCLLVTTVWRDTVEQVIGRLPDAAVGRLDDRLKSAFGL